MGKRIFKSILPMVLGILIFLGLMVGGIVILINSAGSYKTIQIQKTWKYEEVYATVVKVVSRKTRKTTTAFPKGILWQLYYEYEDTNGNVYGGIDFQSRQYSTEEEAKEGLGKFVKLWINRERKIHFTYDPKTYNGEIVGFVVGSIIICIAATIIVILSVGSVKRVKRVLNESKEKEGKNEDKSRE